MANQLPQVEMLISNHLTAMPPSAREKVFAQVTNTAGRLPTFRGKHRAVLAVFRALGLADQHTLVEAKLSHPISYRARLDLHSWLQRLAYVSGGYEQETVRFLMRLWETSQRGYLLDVGANVGLISIPFALLAPDARVFAVEPVLDNFRALVENVTLNGLGKRITALHSALGDSEKSVDIQVEGDLREGAGTGTANILPEDSDYVCERVPLALHTLDEMLASGQIDSGCAVMKIDTDGYDLKVLEGGRHFLAENRPIIFGEFSVDCMAWHGQAVKDVQIFATSVGYEVWARVGHQMEFASEVDVHSYTQDLLLIPSEDAGKYLWCRADAA